MALKTFLSFYVYKSAQKANSSDIKVAVVVRGWAQERGLNVKGHKDNFSVMEMLHIFTMVMAAVSNYQNSSHCTVCVIHTACTLNMPEFYCM